MAASDSVISLALFDAAGNNEKIASNSKEAGTSPPLLVIKGQSGVSLDLSQVLMNSELLSEFDNLFRAS